MLLRRPREGQNSFSLVGVAASTKKGLGESRGLVGCKLERSCVGCFGCLIRSMGIGRNCFRFGLATVELAHHVSANGPRGDRGGRGLCVFSIRTLVSRTDQAAFDQDVRALFDCPRDVFRESWAEYANTVPLGFRGPFVLRVLPGSPGGDRKNCEVCPVAARLTPFWVGSTNPTIVTELMYMDFLLFLPHFLGAHRSEGFCSQSEWLLYGRDPESLGGEP
jgi:hypothetical protein